MHTHEYIEYSETQNIKRHFGTLNHFLFPVYPVSSFLFILSEFGQLLLALNRHGAEP